MSNQDMLGPLVRVLVTLDNVQLGLCLDLARKLSGQDGTQQEKQLKRFLRREPCWCESSEDTLHIDRSKRPSYPAFVDTVMHPELEGAGPTDYVVRSEMLWRHDGQKGGGYIKGIDILRDLEKTDDLKNHGTFRDLEEIQKMGIAFFRRHFSGQFLFAWGSVVRNRYGVLYVPFLCEFGGKVLLRWGWLAVGWYDDSPGLRLAS